MMLRYVIYLGYYLINVFFMKDVIAFWLTLPVMILVLYNVGKLKDKYVGVADMLTFIIYMFFVIQPLQMIDHGHINTDGPVSPITYHNYYIVAAGVMVIIFYTIFTVGQRLLETDRLPAHEVVIARQWAEVLLIASALGCLGFILLSGGIENTLASRSEKSRDDINLFSIVVLAVQIVSTFLLATQVRARLDRHLVYFVAAVGLLLITSNPFNSARFFLIAIYVPLAFILLRGRIATSIFYSGALFGIIVLMPILSTTTRLGSSVSLRETDAASLLRLPYIDVFDMLVECARYTDVNGHTWGMKMIGVIFFIVPRSIWTSKPTLNALDIGNELAEDRIAGTSNLSMFVIGDGYRDLGYVGVAIASVLLVLVVHWLIYRRPTIINGSPVLAYSFIASLPILIRGPLSAVLPLFFLEVVLLAAFARVLARPAPPMPWRSDNDVVDSGVPEPPFNALGSR